jgi:hypothetical protein
MTLWLFAHGSSVIPLVHAGRASGGPDVGFDAEPTGLSKDRGSEVDLVLGYHELDNVSLELFLSYFMPGRAFAEPSDDAFSAMFVITVYGF